MKQFTALMHCPVCEKKKKGKGITPHRVYFCQLYGDPPDMYVHIEHRCIKVLLVSGKGRNRKVYICGHTRQDMLHVKDYNALVKLAKLDFPNDPARDEDDDSIPHQLTA
jgi:hypothetical protein